jgi:hypothetical protein
VRLRNTAGSVDNLALLATDSGAGLAFVQSGLAESTPSMEIVALGSLFYADELYNLRRNIDLIRRKLDESGARESTPNA